MRSRTVGAVARDLDPFSGLDSARILPHRVSTVRERSESSARRHGRGALIRLRRRPSGRGHVHPWQPAYQGRGTRVYQDRTLSCRDCSEEFLFSAGEQAFFASKGLQNDPQRCPTCRANAKRARSVDGPREFHAAICGECGGQAIVPFAPRNDRPVYCSSCFDKVRAGTASVSASPALNRRLRRPAMTIAEPLLRRRIRPGMDRGGRSGDGGMGVIIIREMVGTSPNSWRTPPGWRSRPRPKPSATSVRSRS